MGTAEFMLMVNMRTRIELAMNFLNAASPLENSLIIFAGFAAA